MVEIGKQYRFSTDGADSTWKAWDGSTCTVLRPLTEKEADIADVGPMWRIRFDDGHHTETDAFDDELHGPYKDKITLVAGYIAPSMVVDLQYGQPTENGDRKSQYYDFATVMGRKSFVRVALIEDKVGLPESEQGYRLHVLNDIDEREGYFLLTDSLDEAELVELIDDLVFDLACGRQ